MSVSNPEQVVEGVEWDDFVAWFPTVWEQGEHVALIGPTGEGKTTVAAQLMLMRKYVLALDPKGGDSTLAKLETSHGFRRITSWPPPREVYDEMEEGKPARLIVGGKVRKLSEFATKLKPLFERALDGAFEQEGWTTYVDELQLAADRRMMNLMAKIELMLIASRDRKVTMVTSYQRPANVPKTASNQATWLIVYHTRDRDTVDVIAHMMGRPKDEVRGVVGVLPRYSVVIVNRSPRMPMLVTMPDPL